MEKYRVFDKLAKTKWYSFYRAENTETRETVVVKKLQRETSWQEILKNRNISLMNSSKVQQIAKIKQIVKDSTNFYCIFDNFDQNLETVIRGELQKEQIFKIARSIIQMIAHLHEGGILPRQLRPCSMFTTQGLHGIRLAHLQALPGKDLTKLDLVQLQDLRYCPPEVVLTSKDPDERSMVFMGGLLISQLILGRPLLTANTKINYIFQLCKLFPEESIAAEGEPSNQSRISQLKQQQRFESLLGQFNFSNQFIALLREMLKIDRNQRIVVGELLQAFDLIVANQQNFLKDNQVKTVQAVQTIKPNVNQAPINKEIIDVQIQLDFEKKPTLSTAPNMKINSAVLPIQKNVDDDAVQPIIIKKSSKPFQNGNSMPVPLNKDPIKMSRTTKQQTISTVRRPQLTNYALNQGNNLGVKLGFQPTLFSENDNDF